MCGVFAAYHPGGIQGNFGQLELSSSKLEHRGPDQIGSWFNQKWYVGFRRLAITGGVESTQPYISEDGNFICLFNGEIYNFMDVRSDLVSRGWTFSGSSEIEVIVKAFLQWGDSSFHKFDGQFAIILIDLITNELRMVRDRFGEKPLYYNFSGERVLISSEIQPIANMSATALEIDEVAACQLLIKWYVQEPRTIYRNVFAVPPNSLIKVDLEEQHIIFPLESTPIHTIHSESSSSEPSFDDALHYYDKLLEEAVKKVYPSSGTPALMMSGGFDSTLIAHYLVENNLPFEAFSSNLPNSIFDESEEVSSFSRYLNCEVNFIPIREPKIEDLIASLSNLDMPIAEASFYAAWKCGKAISERGNKVVILGDGGDEILAGYPTYQATLLSNQLPTQTKTLFINLGRFLTKLPVSARHNSNFDRLVRFLLFQNVDALQSHALWRSNANFGLIGNFLTHQQLNDYRKAEQELIDYSKSHANDLLLSAMLLDRISWLSSGNLMKNDRAFMLFGVENRTPYLTHNLVNYIDALPSATKIDFFRTKKLSRALFETKFRGISSPLAKKGWSFPLKSWISNIENSKEFHLSELPKILPGVEAVFQGKQYGIQGSQRLKWSILVLELWLQTRSRL